MSKLKPILLALLFGVIFFITHYQSQFIGLEHFDEGVRILASVNMLEGKLPYRDFISLYPPGYFVYNAFIFKLFGSTVFNYRLAALFLHSLTVALAVYLAAEYGNIIFGIITAFMLVIFQTNIANGSMPFVLLSYIFFLIYIKGQNKNVLFLSGITCGFTSFFRLDFAFYAFLSTAITFYIFKLTQEKNRKISLIRKLIKVTLKQYFKGIYIFVVGVIIGLIPLIIFTWKAGWIESWQNLIVNSRQVTINRSLPFPRLMPNYSTYRQNFPAASIQDYLREITYGWIFYFPYLVCLICVIDILYRKKYLLKNHPNSFFIRILLILSILLFSTYMRFRADIEHTWPIYFLAMILFPFSLTGLNNTLNKSRGMRFLSVLILCSIFIIFWSKDFLILLIKYLLLISAILLIYLSFKRKSLIKLQLFSFFPIVILFLTNLFLLDFLRVYRSGESYPKDLQLLDVPRAGKIYVSTKKEGAYINLVKYLLANNQRDDPMFIGSIRHDVIFINDTLLQFLTNTHSPTKYWWYDPGIQSSQPIQQEMISDLERTKPKFAVLWALASISDEPNLSSRSSGVNLLDKYIRENYTLTKQFGYYFVLERKDSTQ